jgi:hypothetical protein
MLDKTFKINIFKMCVMWSMVGFATYILHFQLKYLHGNIFENTNYIAISEVIAILFGGFIYSFMGGLKATYSLAFCISIVGGLGILHRENNYDSDNRHLLASNQLEFYLRMASLIFIAKFGIAMGLLASQLSCMADSRIFPVEKRTIALGFCSLIGQSVTAFAPLINEI